MKKIVIFTCMLGMFLSAQAQESSVRFVEGRYRDISSHIKRRDPNTYRDQKLEEIHDFIDAALENPFYQDRIRLFGATMQVISSQIELVEKSSSCSDSDRSLVVHVVEQIQNDYHLLYLRSGTTQENTIGLSTGFWMDAFENGASALNINMVQRTTPNSYTFDAFQNNILGTRRIEIRGNATVVKAIRGDLLQLDSSSRDGSDSSMIQVELDSGCVANGYFKYQAILQFNKEAGYMKEVDYAADSLDEFFTMQVNVHDLTLERIKKSIVSCSEELEKISIEIEHLRETNGELNANIGDLNARIEILNEQIEAINNLAIKNELASKDTLHEYKQQVDDLYEELYILRLWLDYEDYIELKKSVASHSEEYKRRREHAEKILLNMEENIRTLSDKKAEGKKLSRKNQNKLEESIRKKEFYGPLIKYLNLHSISVD
ncbi:MAG: hypothetical protein R3A11_08430 [Bdellovibrionota bacterium]